MIFRCPPSLNRSGHCYSFEEIEAIHGRAKRDANQTSIIVSTMKGKPVVRKTNLVLLCTTSLYGVGSSQYNRVKIPIKQIEIDSDKSIIYKDLGHSQSPIQKVLTI